MSTKCDKKKKKLNKQVFFHRVQVHINVSKKKRKKKKKRKGIELRLCQQNATRRVREN